MSGPSEPGNDWPTEAFAHVAVALAREHLASGRSFVFRAFGESMWPTYRSGASVRVEPCEQASIRCGDVVLVELNQQLVLHRVVHRTGDTLTTKGDGVPHPDPPLPLGAVLGRVERRRRDLGLAWVSRTGGRHLWRVTTWLRRQLSR